MLKPKIRGRSTDNQNELCNQTIIALPDGIGLGPDLMHRFFARRNTADEGVIPQAFRRSGYGAVLPLVGGFCERRIERSYGGGFFR